MSIYLLAVDIRHERRLRLLFSRALDSSAFGTAPPYYAITSEDSRGYAPAVSAALALAGDSKVVELTLSEDLVKGGKYRVALDAVPGNDASVTDPGTYRIFQYGLNSPKRDVERLQRFKDDLLYGVDLLWTGADFQETATGDLDSVAGTPNVTKALHRVMESNGLPWDPAYGAHARDFVDSPSPAAGTLRGAVLAQVAADPRVKKATVEFVVDDEKTYLTVKPELISGADIKPVTMTVPLQ